MQIRSCSLAIVHRENTSLCQFLAFRHRALRLVRVFHEEKNWKRRKKKRRKYEKTKCEETRSIKPEQEQKIPKPCPPIPSLASAPLPVSWCLVAIKTPSNSANCGRLWARCSRARLNFHRVGRSRAAWGQRVIPLHEKEREKRSDGSETAWKTRDGGV